MERGASRNERPRHRGKDALKWLVIAVATATMGWPAMVLAAPVVFKAAGSTPADIQATVEEFRNALGDNRNVGGHFEDGRREINWDAVPDAFASPHNLPANFFNKNSPRGVVFFTPGSGFRVSARDGVGPVEFGELRPDASKKFAAFSRPRLFTALASPITEILFFVPGTAQAATSTAFGSVFTDVDRPESTKIEYFDVNGALLFSGFVPAAHGDETLSFLGVAFDAGEEVFLVRITSGDVELGGTNRGGEDLVVMDDFIYAEPQPLP